MDGPLEFLRPIQTSKMFKLLTFFSFIRSLITMNPVLIFAFLVAGSLVWQNFGQEENWDLADQTEAQKAARLEELCQKDIPCLRRCTGSGAFGLSCTEHCGHQAFFKEICKSRPKSGQEEIRPWDFADPASPEVRQEYIRPSKPNNVQKSSESQSLWDTIWPLIVFSLVALQFAPFGLLCWLLTVMHKLFESLPVFLFKPPQYCYNHKLVNRKCKESLDQIASPVNLTD